MYFQAEKKEQEAIKNKKKADAGWNDTHQQVTAEVDDLNPKGNIQVLFFFLMKKSKCINH